MGSWASWDEPRQPRETLTPTGVEKALYCPRCATGRIFGLSGEENDLALWCTRCRYRMGDPLTDQELLHVMDRFRLPVPLSESRVVA